VTDPAADGRLRVAMLTREYPPEVYGGAGVHVEYLAREVGRLVDLTVHCQGADRAGAVAHRPWDQLAGANSALQTISADLSMTAAAAGADLVHSHTWYANLAGFLAGQLYGIPHVMTAHSLEPLRPWKAEQLGGGYALSSWCERTAIESAAAVIAVSDGMAADILDAYPAVAPERVHVIRNGIDTVQYAPDPGTDVLDRFGIDPGRPSVVFVGRVTRQKGVPVLLRAAEQLDPAAQLVLCAGQADTPELAAEVAGLADHLRATRPGVIWIEGMLAKPDVIQILSHATVFACPSLYEPLGIVNLEAMACGTAVVGSRVGGIPEVVADGRTGLLAAPPPWAPPGGSGPWLSSAGRASPGRPPIFTKRWPSPRRPRPERESDPPRVGTIASSCGTKVIMGRHADDRVRANDPFMTVIVIALLALLAATCLLAGL
jgi:starch synthase